MSAEQATQPHEAPALSPVAQEAADAETEALQAHMAQAQIAYFGQRLYQLAVENAELRERLADAGEDAPPA